MADSILKVKINGEWVEIPVLQGEKGEPGPKGDRGEQGLRGPSGADGADGYTPVKGTDYFTEADKAEMVNAVIAALPTAESEEF